MVISKGGYINMTQKPKRMRLIALFAVMTAAVLSVITCGEVCGCQGLRRRDVEDRQRQIQDF